LNQQPYIQEDEITLKELILKIQEYWHELWRNWLLIGLITIPFLGYFLFKTFTHVPKYEAEVRFIVEGQGGSNLGALGGLLGSFGINRSSGQTNPYKIIEVAKSKRMIGEVLFSRSISNEEYIGNNILDLYKLPETWAKKNPEMGNIRFKSTDIESFNEFERSAFLALYGKSVGSRESTENALITIGLNEDTGIFSVSGNTEDETLTLDLVNNLYENTKFFFEEQVLEDKIKAIKILQSKSDSIDILIENKISSRARFEDTSRGLISRQTESRKEKLQGEILGLTSAWAELQKSLQIADFELQSTKPLFLIIDQPYSPIRPTRESLIRNIIIAIFFGGFLGSGFIVARYIYRKTIA
jgi:capsular polysaccharide biosynthesis protein